MRKIFLLVIIMIAAGSLFNLQAQVTIGSNAEPNANAVLDLVSSNKGLLLPRLALTSTSAAAPLSAHVAGMTVYNTATASSGATYVSPGFYYNDGTRWVRLYLGYNNWFYMPSVAFDTRNTLAGQTRNLYNDYLSQFSSPPIKSAGAPNTIPYIPAATDLYYYITAFDSNVFSNISITADGIMTYDVTAAATDFSFINIVFVLK
jgi:hypothetical protein